MLTLAYVLYRYPIQSWNPVEQEPRSSREYLIGVMDRRGTCSHHRLPHQHLILLVREAASMIERIDAAVFGLLAEQIE
jgi:hypothetical protein